MMSTVTVIIVNYNSGKMLWRCLSAVEQQSVQPDEILVVDNASEDHSLECLSNWPNVSVIKMEQNIGFAKANNIALEQISTDFVALVNPDAFPERRWLESLLEAAIVNPAFGSFASFQLKDDEMDVIDGLGDCIHVSGYVWRRRHGKKVSFSDNLSRQVFSACAGAALYRTHVVKQVGAFDEKFFCYCEDVDLGFRLQLAGYRCLFVPDAKIKHIGSAITGQNSTFTIYHGHRNLIFVLFKNVPASVLPIVIPLHLIVTLILFAVYARRGKLGVLLKAKLDALKMLPLFFESRRLIQRSRQITFWETLKIFCIKPLM